MLAAIKLLRECFQWLGRPHGSVRRAKDADVQRLLLDNAGDVEGQKENTLRSIAQSHRWTLALCRCARLFRNQESINHDQRIVAKQFRLSSFPMGMGFS